MTETERNILETLKTNLQKSTKTSWTRGDVDAWATFARKMQSTIDDSTAILDTLISKEKNPIEADKQ